MVVGTGGTSLVQYMQRRAATGIWLGDVGFRSLDDLYLMGWLVLLYRRGPIWPWAVLCGGAWVTVFVELVRYV